METKNKIESTIVNLNLLNDCFFGETKLQIDVISIFLKETPVKMDLLFTGIKESNFKQIEENAHFLKSSFGTLGVDLNKEFLVIENLAREKSELNTIKTILNDTNSLYNLSINEYKRILYSLQESEFSC
jgi:hypothetical protein